VAGWALKERKQRATAAGADLVKNDQGWLAIVVTLEPRHNLRHAAGRRHPAAKKRGDTGGRQVLRGAEACGWR
jgi:hypothetical protein